MTLELVIWSMFAGIVAASFIAVYNRRVTGKIVRLLYAKEAHSPSASLTLGELGLSRNLFVRFSLRKNGMLRKVVYDFDPFAGNFKLRAINPRNRKRDLDRMRFYVPPEVNERAETMYLKEGTTILTAILSVALFLAIALFCLAVIPWLRRLLDNFILIIKENFR
mgnify:CR=1 FL=1